jgi:hypothetical protein
VFKLFFVFIVSVSTCLFLGFGSCSRQDQSSLSIESKSATLFENTILPLLAQYCADCHAPGEMEDLDFLAATTHSDIAGLRDVYAGVTEAMGNRTYGWSAFEPTRRKRVGIGEAALAGLAGTYECLPKWSHARSRLALFPNMSTLEFKVMDGRLIADVPRGAGTEGRVDFLPQSEFQVMQRRNGRLIDFLVEDGKVTGFKFRGFEARRVD